jgi:hypothetical protein
LRIWRTPNEKIKVSFETTQELISDIFQAADCCPGDLALGYIVNDEFGCDPDERDCDRCVLDFIYRITVKEGE